MGQASKASQLELRLFDETESELVARALVALAQIRPGDADILSAQLSQLADINALIWRSPSLRTPQTLGGRTRHYESLVQHLVRTDGLSGDLDLPIKATLQRTFLMAKIQFLRAFVSSTSAFNDHAPELKPLSIQLREELAQSIYTQMAEDLLLALLRKPDIAQHTKLQSARQLIAIWDNATLEIDDFCPLLESAWNARNHVNAQLGSLLGATEYFRLVAQNCEPEFLDFFARDEVSESENQAFSEFLFGLTWEELTTLRKAMSRQDMDTCSEAWASQTLGRALEHDTDTDDESQIDPVALYRSYYRRQFAADYRIVSESPGPRRTAEAYLMIYLLDQQRS